MDKKLLTEIFSKLADITDWSMQLLQIKSGKSSDIFYFAREIKIDPPEKLTQHIMEISKYYSTGKGNLCNQSIEQYTGDVVSHCIYKLESVSPLVSDAFKLFNTAIAAPDCEISVMEMRKWSAAVFTGTGSYQSKQIPVVLVSIQNPITCFSNKFLYGKSIDKFRPIEGPILTMRTNIDVALIDNIVYLFTLSGEKLFNMERAYKAVCSKKVEEIAHFDLFSDTEKFISAATSGRNPRRFVSFQESHFEALKNPIQRARLSSTFKIFLKDDKIDTEDPKNVERLVKFLCNKAMIDPCDECPMEVAASKPWQ